MNRQPLEFVGAWFSANELRLHHQPQSDNNSVNRRPPSYAGYRNSSRPSSKGAFVPRISSMLFCIGAVLCCCAPSRAQMGMNIFQKPTIASVFHPVVGGGAVYQNTRRDAPNDPPSSEEMSVVAKETVDGKDAYWLEFSREDKRAGGTTYAKALVSNDDIEFHRMIVQSPGKQAMEMPFHPSPKAQDSITKNVGNWHVVGAESITVPAGTFSCQHWKNDSGSEIWTSDQVTPFGAVKEVTGTGTKVLVKLLTDAQDHITGPVKTFDPQEMQRQMMEQMQKQKQTPN
jgi:hypothetical protein